MVVFLEIKRNCYAHYVFRICTVPTCRAFKLIVRCGMHCRQNEKVFPVLSIKQNELRRIEAPDHHRRQPTNNALQSLFLKMKSTIVALTLLLSIATHVAAAPVKISAILRQMKSCEVNMCFVIDRSTTLTSAEFTEQSEFVLLSSATASFDPGFSFAAYTYGPGKALLKGFSSNIDDFLMSVEGNTQAAPAANGTGLPGAIDGCASALQQRPARGSVMVILGGGATSNAEKTLAIASARAAETTGSSIIAVPATTSVKPFFQQLAGSSGSVVEEDDFLKFDSALQTVISKVCN